MAGRSGELVQGAAEVPAEGCRGGVRGVGKRPDHHFGAVGDPVEPVRQLGAQSSGHPVPCHAAADRLSYHQPDLAGAGVLGRLSQQVHHHRTAASPAAPLGHRGEISGGPQAMRGRQHRGMPGSGGQLGAALATSGLQDGASGTSPHPQTEAVGLGPAAVVRLEGPLAHGLAPSHHLRTGCTACWRHSARWTMARPTRADHW